MAKTVNLTIFGSNLEVLSLEVLSNKQRTNFVHKINIRNAFVLSRSPNSKSKAQIR